MRRFTIVSLFVGLALAALFIAMLVPTVEKTRTQDTLARCKDHLRLFGVDLSQYMNLNNGALPVSATIDGPQTILLADLAASKCLTNPATFYCPAMTTGTLTYTDANFKAGVIGYYYFSAENASDGQDLSQFLRNELIWPREVKKSMDPKTWVMSDVWVSGFPTAHAGYRKGVNYLMLNGSVDFIGESPRQAFH